MPAGAIECLFRFSWTGAFGSATFPERPNLLFSSNEQPSCSKRQPQSSRPLDAERQPIANREEILRFTEIFKDPKRLETIETLTDFPAKEKMPWMHWWNGSKGGGMIDDWDVRYYPTVYVLDAQGVIRHKDLRGEDLEKAVDALLAEQTKANSARVSK